MNGCYEALEGGNATDALVDLTGGIAELYEVVDKDKFFHFMLKAFEEKAFMTCSVQVKNYFLKFL
jgi:calpain